MPTNAPKPVIIIDSREQTPFTFTNLPTRVDVLDAGDYSISGLTHLIAGERKTLSDLLACIGRERDRFKRELQRLAAYRYRLLIVETDAAALEAGDWIGKLQPAHVLGALASWTAFYGLPVWLGGSHEASARFVERWLYQAARHITETLQVANAVVEETPDEHSY